MPFICYKERFIIRKNRNLYNAKENSFNIFFFKCYILLSICFFLIDDRLPWKELSVVVVEVVETTCLEFCYWSIPQFYILYIFFQEQYKFCHQSVINYLQTFDTYSNFDLTKQSDTMGSGAKSFTDAVYATVKK